MIDIRIAEKNEFKKVLDFYYSVIDSLGENNLPKWKKNLYPSNNYLLSAIKNNQLYVGEIDEKVVCAMVLNHEGCNGYDSVKWNVDAKDCDVLIIHVLGVHPCCKGKGYGKALIKKAVEIAKEKRCKAVRLDVLSNNLPAVHMYESCGFCRIDNVKLFYDDIGLADFYMYEYNV